MKYLALTGDKGHLGGQGADIHAQKDLTVMPGRRRSRTFASF